MIKLRKLIKKEDEGLWALACLVVMAVCMLLWVVNNSKQGQKSFTILHKRTYNLIEQVDYLMECEEHQAQIDSLFMQRIDYLMETSSEFIDDDYIHGFTEEERRLLLYRGKE